MDVVDVPNKGPVLTDTYLYVAMNCYYYYYRYIDIITVIVIQTYV